MQAEPSTGRVNPNLMLILAGLLAGAAAFGFATFETIAMFTEKPDANEALATRRPKASAPEVAPPAPVVPVVPEAPAEPLVEPPAPAETMTATPLPEHAVPQPIVEVEGLTDEELADAPLPRSLNPHAATLQSIQAQVRELQPLMQGCYELSLTTNPQLEGLWELQIVLDAAEDGTTLITADAIGTSMSDETMEMCLEAFIEAQDFGTVDRRISVTRRMSFSAP